MREDPTISGYDRPYYRTHRSSAYETVDPSTLVSVNAAVDCARVCVCCLCCSCWPVLLVSRPQRCCPLARDFIVAQSAHATRLYAPRFLGRVSQCPFPFVRARKHLDRRQRIRLERIPSGSLSLAPTSTRWVLDDSGAVDSATRTAARVTVCIVLLGEESPPRLSRRDTADRAGCENRLAAPSRVNASWNVTGDSRRGKNRKKGDAIDC